jgi:hypothetical protein
MKPINPIRSLSVALPVALLACAGAVSEDNRPCPCATGWTCCPDKVCVAPGASCKSGDGGSAVESTEGGESGSAVASTEGGAGAPARVTGTCDEPETGSVTQFSSVAEVNALLVGRWLHCSGPFLTLAPDEVGIEFAQDGTWYALTQTDGGPVVRSTAGSLTEQGSWLVSDEGSLAPGVERVQLNIYHGAGGDGGQPTFSITPTKLSMFTSAAAAGGAHVYVAIP